MIISIAPYIYYTINSQKHRKSYRYAGGRGQ